MLIPYKADPGLYSFLFVANLYDQEGLGWTFENGLLEAVFSIRNHEEPPVFLVSNDTATKYRADTVPVQLQMLVSRFEIQVENPPAWVTGLDVSLSRVAASVTSGFVLGDTTYIRKQISLDAQGGEYLPDRCKYFSDLSGSACLAECPACRDASCCTDYCGR